MDLISEGALRVAKLVWRPGHGGFAFTVVCKATFALQPDVSPLAAAQEPVTEADIYTREGGGLVFASERVPFKKRPEVLVAGHAYAPEGQPVPSLVARLAAGEIDKAIQVVGDRDFGLDGRLGDPAPFTRMPLVWERAAGGPGTSNPAGTPPGYATRADPFGRVPAPNLLPVGLRLLSRSDLVPPVGFGPIAPHWPSRAACLHRHAAGWDPNLWHERPLPIDIDLAYLNAAPPDQQRALPFGEEAITLENLHPRFARLATRLAPVTPIATVDHGAGPQPLPLRCDTLVIDTDRGRAMLVWRAHVLLDHPDRPGRVLVTGPAAPDAAPPAWGEEDDGTATVTQGVFTPPPAVLPFSGAAAWDPGSAPLPATIGATAPAAAAAVTTRHATLLRTGAATPPSGAEAADQTQTPGLVFAAAAMPFVFSHGERASRREAVAAETAPALPFVPSPPDDGDGPPTPRRPAPLDAAPSQTTGAPRAVDRASPLPDAQPPSAAAFAWVAKPPLLGPIAVASAGASETRDTEGRSAAKAAEAGETPAAEPEPDVAFDAYPPERCGAIAARLAYDAGAASDILRAEDLDAARWQRVHAHWLDRIRDDAARSRKALLSKYDDAYVSALEAERGPIALTDYARLAEAAERSAVAGALAERGLPEGAWPHLHRVWIGRIVKDVRVGKQVRTAIEARRAAG